MTIRVNSEGCVKSRTKTSPHAKAADAILRTLSASRINEREKEYPAFDFWAPISRHRRVMA